MPVRHSQACGPWWDPPQSALPQTLRMQHKNAGKIHLQTPCFLCSGRQQVAGHCCKTPTPTWWRNSNQIPRRIRELGSFPTTDNLAKTFLNLSPTKTKPLIKCVYSSKSLKIQKRKNRRKELKQSEPLVNKSGRISCKMCLAINYILWCLELGAFVLKAAVSREDELISVITAVCQFPQVFSQTPVFALLW